MAKATSAGLAAIENIVVVMLENRSFDHMLGYLYSTSGNKSPLGQPFDGLTGNEHGGYYDHVVPPANATPPDNSVGEFGFDFKRFGVRVPAVFVSPFIEAGTVLRPPAGVPFDHTSILATIEKRWKLKPLTKRDATAPDLSAVLTLSKARTDDPLAKVKAPSTNPTPHAAVAPAGPDHLEQVYADSVSRLPIPDEKGHAHPQEVDHFASGKEAMAWAHKRYAEFNKRKKK